jgi:catechol-2,3-dioxygenase
MAKIVNSRCVLAVRNLEVSTRYYVDILGFRKDPIDVARAVTKVVQSPSSGKS